MFEMKEKKLFSEMLCREYPEHPAIAGSGSGRSCQDLHRGINGLSRKSREME